jgi:hypothetical protein
MSEKISGHHLERGAYIYVRQSTAYQVRHHLEGKERQYALTERAKQLGFTKVVVIDEDLGRSGAGTQERQWVRPLTGIGVSGDGWRSVCARSFSFGAQQSRLASSG